MTRENFSNIWEGHSRLRKTKVIRITSYNVCYTKLLRTFLVCTFINNKSLSVTNGLCSKLTAVITSYSIHYTKLYDIRIRSPSTCMLELHYVHSRGKHRAGVTLLKRQRTCGVDRRYLAPVHEHPDVPTVRRLRVRQHELRPIERESSHRNNFV